MPANVKCEANKTALHPEDCEYPNCACEEYPTKQALGPLLSRPSPMRTLIDETEYQRLKGIEAAAIRATSINHDNPSQLRAAIEDLATSLQGRP